MIHNDDQWHNFWSRRHAEFILFDCFVNFEAAHTRDPQKVTILGHARKVSLARINQPRKSVIS